MFDISQITEIEESLAEAGLTVKRLCEEAGIAETTWSRWKNGSFFPSHLKWQKIKIAFESLMASVDDAA